MNNFDKGQQAAAELIAKEVSPIQYVILGKSAGGSRWLVGLPQTDKDSLNDDMKEIAARLSYCEFEIIEYTENTLNEIYPDRDKWKVKL